MYVYSNILGTFVFNQNFQMREKVLFSPKDSLAIVKLLSEPAPLESETQLMAKLKGMRNLRTDPDKVLMQKVYSVLEQYKDEFYSRNLFLTKVAMRESVTDDILIVQTASALQELNKIINMTAKRLREWYSYELPEVSEKLTDHKGFAMRISEDYKKLQKDFGIDEPMGKHLEKRDHDEIIRQSELLLDMFDHKEQLEAYLENSMKKTCPNMTEVAGYLTGSKLLVIAGSLRDMVMMPASTIQLLGAEKALFRHMLNKNAKSPKHGVIIEHPIVQRVDRKDKGKASRALADKISLAVKVDYFKGEFIGDKLRKMLEDRFT